MSSAYHSLVSLNALDAEKMVAACAPSVLRACTCGWHMRASACRLGDGVSRACGIVWSARPARQLGGVRG